VRIQSQADYPVAVTTAWRNLVVSVLRTIWCGAYDSGVPQPQWFVAAVANKTQVMIGLMALSHVGPMMLGVAR
jgi:hypothetical protein